MRCLGSSLTRNESGSQTLSGYLLVCLIPFRFLCLVSFSHSATCLLCNVCFKFENWYNNLTFYQKKEKKTYEVFRLINHGQAEVISSWRSHPQQNNWVTKDDVIICVIVRFCMSKKKHNMQRLPSVQKDRMKTIIFNIKTKISFNHQDIDWFGLIYQF